MDFLRLYRWLTEIEASRVYSVWPNTSQARSHSFLSAGPQGRVMACIHRCQQANIFCRVLLLEAGHRALAALELARLTVLAHQPSELLTGIAADLHQVTECHHFVLTGEPQIADLTSPHRIQR